MKKKTRNKLVFALLLAFIFSIISLNNIFFVSAESSSLTEDITKYTLHCYTQADKSSLTAKNGGLAFETIGKASAMVYSKEKAFNPMNLFLQISVPEAACDWFSIVLGATVDAIGTYPLSSNETHRGLGLRIKYFSGSYKIYTDVVGKQAGVKTTVLPESIAKGDVLTFEYTEGKVTINGTEITLPEDIYDYTGETCYFGIKVSPSSSTDPVKIYFGGEIFENYKNCDIEVKDQGGNPITEFTAELLTEDDTVLATLIYTAQNPYAGTMEFTCDNCYLGTKIRIIKQGYVTAVISFSDATVVLEEYVEPIYLTENFAEYELFAYTQAPYTSISEKNGGIAFETVGKAHASVYTKQKIVNPKNLTLQLKCTDYACGYFTVVLGKTIPAIRLYPLTPNETDQGLGIRFDYWGGSYKVYADIVGKHSGGDNFIAFPATVPIDATFTIRFLNGSVKITDNVVKHEIVFTLPSDIYSYTGEESCYFGIRVSPGDTLDPQNIYFGAEVFENYKNCDIEVKDQGGNPITEFTAELLTEDDTVLATLIYTAQNPYAGTMEFTCDNCYLGTKIRIIKQGYVTAVISFSDATVVLEEYVEPIYLTENFAEYELFAYMQAPYTSISEKNGGIAFETVGKAHASVYTKQKIVNPKNLTLQLKCTDYACGYFTVVLGKTIPAIRLYPLTPNETDQGLGIRFDYWGGSYKVYADIVGKHSGGDNFIAFPATVPIDATFTIRFLNGSVKITDNVVKHEIVFTLPSDIYSYTGEESCYFGIRVSPGDTLDPQNIYFGAEVFENYKNCDIEVKDQGGNPITEFTAELLTEDDTVLATLIYTAQNPYAGTMEFTCDNCYLGTKIRIIKQGYVTAVISFSDATVVLEEYVEPIYLTENFAEYELFAYMQAPYTSISEKNGGIAFETVGKAHASVYTKQKIVNPKNLTLQLKCTDYACGYFTVVLGKTIPAIRLYPLTPNETDQGLGIRFDYWGGSYKVYADIVGKHSGGDNFIAFPATVPIDATFTIRFLNGSVKITDNVVKHEIVFTLPSDIYSYTGEESCYFGIRVSPGDTLDPQNIYFGAEVFENYKNCVVEVKDDDGAAVTQFTAELLTADETVASTLTFTEENPYDGTMRFTGQLCYLGMTIRISKENYKGIEISCEQTSAVLERYYTLSVTLSDHSDAAISGAVLKLYKNGMPVTVTVNESDGVYTVSGLYGRYNLTIEKEKFLTVQRDVSHNQYTFDITLDRTGIITIMFGENPVAGSKVMYKVNDGSDQTGITDDSGRLSVIITGNDTVKIISVEGYHTVDNNTVQLSIQSDTATVNVSDKLYLGRIFIKYKGLAVANAVVTISLGGVESTITSDENGILSLEDIWGSNAISILSVEGYRTVIDSAVTLTLDESDKAVNIDEKYFTAKVHIHREGSAIANAEVSYSVNGGDEISVIADENGFIEISGLYGTAEIVISVKDYKVLSDSLTLTDEICEVSVEVDLPDIQGVITLEYNQNPLANADVTLTIDGITSDYRTDEAGKIIIPNVRGGKAITVDSVEGYRTIATGTFTLNDSSTEAVVEVSDKLFKGKVTVKDDEGNVIEADVVFSYGGGSLMITKGEDGSYEKKGLYGTVSVTIIAQGYEFDAMTLTADNPEITVTGRVKASQKKGCKTNILDEGYLLFGLAALALLLSTLKKGDKLP